MRALCGAIITAAALIGLGLTAMGIGTRYSMERAYYGELEKARNQPKGDGEADEPSKKPAPIATPGRVRFSDMDRPLIFTLVFLTSMAIVGLGIAFVGLCYHHLRRDREFQWQKERQDAQQRTTV